MDYRPGLPEENVNVSHNRPIRAFFGLLLSGVVLCGAVYWLLGLGVDWAVEQITPQQEVQLFSGVDLSEEGDLLPEQARLQQLLNELSGCIDVGFPVRLQLIESEEVNALAYPGGNVAVYTGLLGKVSSENGLAFVLAHELGHFKNRDHLRGIGRALVMSVLMTLISGGNTDMGKLFMPVSALQMAQYSQRRESAADVTALQALNCFYGHVGGATELFEVLNKEETSHSGVVSHFFMSHPQLEARIREIKALVVKSSYEVGDIKSM